MFFMGLKEISVQGPEFFDSFNVSNEGRLNWHQPQSITGKADTIAAGYRPDVACPWAGLNAVTSGVPFPSINLLGGYKFTFGVIYFSGAYHGSGSDLGKRHMSKVRLQ